MDSEPGNKPIDTASLIAALHPFGQGGVKFARSTKLWTMFSTSVVLAPSCPLALHKRVNMVIIWFLVALKRLFSRQTSPLVLIISGPNQSFPLIKHSFTISSTATRNHVSCSVSCCVFHMSPKSCLMLDLSAALKAIQHKTRTRFFFYILLSGYKILAMPNLALIVPQNDGIGCKQLEFSF